MTDNRAQTATQRPDSIVIPEGITTMDDRDRAELWQEAQRVIAANPNGPGDRDGVPWWAVAVVTYEATLQYLESERDNARAGIRELIAQKRFVIERLDKYEDRRQWVPDMAERLHPDSRTLGDGIENATITITADDINRVLAARANATPTLRRDEDLAMLNEAYNAIHSCDGRCVRVHKKLGNYLASRPTEPAALFRSEVTDDDVATLATDERFVLATKDLMRPSISLGEGRAAVVRAVLDAWRRRTMTTGRREDVSSKASER